MLRGLYAVTPDEADTGVLVDSVAAAVANGARIVQYRNKIASPELRREQAAAVKCACEANGALLIVNDHAELAHEIDAAGVHIGADDGDIDAARAIVGPDKLIGVSCYRRLELAVDAQEYTWQTLKSAFRPGMGQHIPDRLFWAREEEAADDRSARDE